MRQLTVHDFCIDEDHDDDTSKNTLYGWYMEIFGEDHPAETFFWERVENWLQGEGIHIGSLAPETQFQIWQEVTHELV
jgi:hypothetical protein